MFERIGEHLDFQRCSFKVHLRYCCYDTEFAPVKFKVSEFADGTPFLSTQETGPATNKVLNSHNDFSLRLKPGTSFEQAVEIQDYLNRYVEQIAVMY